MCLRVCVFVCVCVMSECLPLREGLAYKCISTPLVCVCAGGAGRVPDARLRPRLRMLTCTCTHQRQGLWELCLPFPQPPLSLDFLFEDSYPDSVPLKTLQDGRPALCPCICSWGLLPQSRGPVASHLHPDAPAQLSMERVSSLDPTACWYYVLSPAPCLWQPPVCLQQAGQWPGVAPSLGKRLSHLLVPRAPDTADSSARQCHLQRWAHPLPRDLRPCSPAPRECGDAGFFCRPQL